jgi:multisubunit Na+/H+ antiporter MnhE subunit
MLRDTDVKTIFWGILSAIFIAYNMHIGLAITGVIFGIFALKYNQTPAIAFDYLKTIGYSFIVALCVAFFFIAIAAIS